MADSMTNPPRYLDGPHGRIAYRKCEGTGPGIVWLGGFRSDMLGTKAEALDTWARETGRAFVRFDYSGHGESDGAFEDGSIGEWAEDALAAFDALAEGPQILVGSSMGGWIATLLARARPERLAAIVFIAPAPDFTEALMWPAFTDEQRQTIMAEGRLEQPSDYADEPEVITRKLIEDGRNHLVMGDPASTPVPIRAPVRILQGMQDDAVPWTHAVRFAEAIESDDVLVTLVKDGDHRLSEPADLARLIGVLEDLPLQAPST